MFPNKLHTAAIGVWIALLPPVRSEWNPFTDKGRMDKPGFGTDEPGGYQIPNGETRNFRVEINGKRDGDGKFKISYEVMDSDDDPDEDRPHGDIVGGSDILVQTFVESNGAPNTDITKLWDFFTLKCQNMKVFGCQDGPACNVLRPSRERKAEVFIRGAFGLTDVAVVECIGKNMANVVGEPHFQKWDGSWYDYHGSCDLVFVQTRDVSIHIRTKIRDNYSFIESAAVRLGEDIVEVGSFGDYFVNGVSSARLPRMISGFPLTHSQPSKKTHVFKIDMGAGEKVVLKTHKDIVSVQVTSAGQHFQGGRGMLGDFDTLTMLARNGSTLTDDPSAFADEWQVKDDDPKLFVVSREPQYPQKCILPNQKASGRRLGETIARQAAEKACAKQEGGAFEACVFDVMALGDLDIAEEVY